MQFFFMLLTIAKLSIFPFFSGNNVSHFDVKFVVVGKRLVWVDAVW